MKYRKPLNLPPNNSELRERNLSSIPVKHLRMERTPADLCDKDMVGLCFISIKLEDATCA